MADNLRGLFPIRDPDGGPGTWPLSPDDLRGGKMAPTFAPPGGEEEGRVRMAPEGGNMAAW